MIQMREYIKMALDNIKANKGRSFLTMLGIIIGISSVIMIICIGNGAKGNISGMLNDMAGGQICIYPNGRILGEDNVITYEDIQEMKNSIEHVKGVSNSGMVYGTTQTFKGEFDVYVDLGTEDLQALSSDELVDGSYFSKADVEDGRMVCVIDRDSAVTLFGSSDVVGMSIELELYGFTRAFEIVGVTAQKEGQSSLMSLAYGANTIMLDMPYTAVESILGYRQENFDSIYLVAEGPEYSTQVAKDCIEFLEKKHKCIAKDGYLMESFEDSMSTINTVLNSITYFIVLVAAISLLVGGIGVMNIMLVSVTERTREIGIRKALGAKTKSIMIQFLAESCIITLIGGIIGILLGLGGAELICAFIPAISPKLSVSAVVLATFFSSAVGIFFGIYPARKAAKMNPIEALRFQ